jgi:hypothetical protein
LRQTAEEPTKDQTTCILQYVPNTILSTHPSTHPGIIPSTLPRTTNPNTNTNTVTLNGTHLYSMLMTSLMVCLLRRMWWRTESLSSSLEGHHTTLWTGIDSWDKTVSETNVIPTTVTLLISLHHHLNTGVNLMCKVHQQIPLMVSVL